MDALKSALDIVSGGCKIAYGSGNSLSGLSFTPYLAIYLATYSSSVEKYTPWIAIKGMDESICTYCTISVNTDPTSYGAKVTFDDHGVTFSDPSKYLSIWYYQNRIVAIGI